MPALVFTVLKIFAFSVFVISVMISVVLQLLFTKQKDFKLTKNLLITFIPSIIISILSYYWIGPKIFNDS